MTAPLRLCKWLAAATFVSFALVTRAGCQLTIRLTSLPAASPSGATVYVAGSFNRWNPGAPNYALVPCADGGYAITLPDSVRGAIEFKLTLGSWERVETTATGVDVANRTFNIPPTGAETLSVSVEGWRDPASAPAAKRSTASRSVSVMSDSFAMPQLGRARRVWIYLPPDYATSRKRYPVIYMHDGQNVFDAATSFAGEWGVDETLDSLHERGDWGAIVVAVDHGGQRRLDEYNPWVNANRELGGGEGDAYVDFLVATLKPYVDRHYRTLQDRAHTAIAGSSAGALISLYAALRHPEVFGRVALFSIAAWLAAPDIYAFARRAKPARPPARFYLASGAFETSEGQPARDQSALVDTLDAAGFTRGVVTRSITRADGKHAEWFWRREFPAAYRWLFPPERHTRPPVPRRRSADRASTPPSGATGIEADTGAVSART